MYDFVLEQSPAWIRADTAFGRKIYLNVADRAVSKSILLEKVWEPQVGLGLLALLKPDTVFIDIGANIGWFTLLAADYLERAGGTGKVVAVEANPTVVPYLMASVVESGLADRVHCKPYAVSDQTGLVEINAMRSGNLGGIGMGEVLERHSDCHIVPTIRLDDLLQHEARIDVIKIDVEGAEYLALKGGEALLERSRPAIIAELNPTALAAVSNKTAADLVSLLSRLGYKAYDFRAGEFDAPLDELELDSIITHKEYYDVLFKAV